MTDSPASIETREGHENHGQGGIIPGATIGEEAVRGAGSAPRIPKAPYSNNVILRENSPTGVISR